jgi:hypothetical protein
VPAAPNRRELDSGRMPVSCWMSPQRPAQPPQRDDLLSLRSRHCSRRWRVIPPSFSMFSPISIGRFSAVPHWPVLGVPRGRAAISAASSGPFKSGPSRGLGQTPYDRIEQFEGGIYEAKRESCTWVDSPEIWRYLRAVPRRHMWSAWNSCGHRRALRIFGTSVEVIGRNGGLIRSSPRIAVSLAAVE